MQTQPRILADLLDTDFYKLTMMQAVLHHYPEAEVEYSFRCRDGEDLSLYRMEIEEELERLSECCLGDDAQAFLETFPFLKGDFIRFLRLFRFDRNYLHVRQYGDQLDVRVKGPWLHCILFEVPLLAIISEVRNRRRYPDASVADAEDRLLEKFDWLRQAASDDELHSFKVADYGTRRRFSRDVHARIVQLLASDFPGSFVGTSNVHLARIHGVRPLGTMAHEWIMAHQQLGPRLIDSQITALDCWVREYRGRLGIALTDCLTMDAFLADFDLFFAKLFDGLRHDSGDPRLWAEKAIAHYEGLGIDPRSRTLVFSDSLSLQKALELHRELRGRIGTSFGIGTSLTCDLPGVKPMNIVMKMISCNGQPVAKVSDAPGKGGGYDENFVAYLRHVFRID